MSRKIHLILYHTCKSYRLTDLCDDKSLSTLQKYILNVWYVPDSLFSITQVGRSFSTSRNRARKAINNLERRGYIRRYSGGYKSNIHAKICDECKKELESIDVHYHIKITLGVSGKRWGKPFQSTRLEFSNRICGKIIGRRYSRNIDAGWIYEGKICHDCFVRIANMKNLRKFFIRPALIGTRKIK